jgi:alkanesulfonate monooxygenase SsuD/methylene tetrahydromethanopterin reductase-like flavin-dependent oxidoreductase (luciferase family)
VRLSAITLPSRPWEELVEQWRTLDELGLETIWVADHLANPYAPEQDWLEGWSCLAGMALVTQRARVGPLVSPITFRNPAVLAKAALTVDQMSGGRLELGIGAGGSKTDHELAGVPCWEPKERARRLREFVERLDELLSGRSALPLTIAGHAPTALRLAARYARRWNAFGGRGLTPQQALAVVADCNRRLDSLCAELGRDPRGLRRSVAIHPWFNGETPWRSLDAFHELVGRWRAIGIEELVLYYPPHLGMPEGSVTPGVFEAAVASLAL